MFTSWSKISDWERCRRYYEWKNILKKPAPTSAALVVGGAVHEACAAAKRPELNGGQRAEITAAIEVFEETLIKNGATLPADELHACRDTGRLALEQFYQMDDAAPGRIKVVERTAQWRMGNGDVLVGRIDRAQDVDNTLVLIDYKVSKEATQAEVDRNEQLTLYRLLVGKEGVAPDRDVELQLWFVKTGTIVSTRRTEDDLAEMESKVQRIIAEMKGASDYPANLNHPLCPWCEYVEECDAMTFAW